MIKEKDGQVCFAVQFGIFSEALADAFGKYRQIGGCWSSRFCEGIEKRRYREIIVTARFCNFHFRSRFNGRSPRKTRNHQYHSLETEFTKIRNKMINRVPRMGSNKAIYSDGTALPTISQVQTYGQESSCCHQLRDSMESAASFQGQASVSFECNICLEVANDPVVTLCGHLFCWPCLYKWLQRSACKDCPVCKAAVEEEKVIPLYGRGNLQPVDPRTKSFPDIPKRPLGLRSNIVRSEQRYFSPGFFGYGAGAPTTVRLRGITLSTGLGFLPSLLSLQFNEFLDSAGGGYAGTSGAHGRFSHPYTPPPSLSTFVDRRQEAALMSKLVFLTVFVILCLFFL